MKNLFLVYVFFFLSQINAISQSFADTIVPNISKEDELKQSNYVKFNFQIGAVANDSYCNKPYQDVPSNQSRLSSESYVMPGNSYTNMGLNVGFNFIFGKNPYIKHIVGINYVQSKGEYNYNISYISSDANSIYTRGHSELNYKTVAHYINIVTGIRFTVFKKFHLEPCISLNVNPYTSAIINGLYTKQYGADPTTYYSIKDSIPKHQYSNTAFSFTPRISYDLKIKNQHFEIYASRNIAIKYRLPWWSFGITYYPFKKLR